MNKSLFIIGAGPGISAATAARFTREGWTVVLGSRNPAKLEQEATKIRQAGGGDVHILPVDAADAASIRSSVAKAEALTGGLGAVLFNAAVLRQQNPLEITDADIASDTAANINGALTTIQASVAAFGQRGGKILLTGGGFALYPQADWALLSAGKAAIRNIAQGLHTAFGDHGIRIGTVTVATFVQPGSTEASGVADSFWSLANDSESPWEVVYPAA